jgi:hypothetical protein
LQNLIEDNSAGNSDAWKIEDRLNDQIVRIGRKAEDNIQ